MTGEITPKMTGPEPSTGKQHAPPTDPEGYTLVEEDPYDLLYFLGNYVEAQRGGSIFIILEKEAFTKSLLNTCAA